MFAMIIDQSGKEKTTQAIKKRCLGLSIHTQQKEFRIF